MTTIDPQPVPFPDVSGPPAVPEVTVRAAADPERFQTTQWSLVEAYQRSSSEDERRHFLGELTRIYWRPVRGYLRRKGYSEHEAEDMAQGFFTDVVLGRVLFQRADRSRAAFRALLFTALKNYVIDDKRASRPDDGAVSIRADESVADAPPDRAFDESFVTAILEESLRRCEQQLIRARRPHHWAAFDRFVRMPAGGVERPQLKELADELDFVSPAAVGSAVYAVKQQLQDILETTIRRTVTGEDADAEIRYLLSLVGVRPKGEKPQP